MAGSSSGRGGSYWMFLGGGVALIALGWIGERLDWPATLTLILFGLGCVGFVAGRFAEGPRR